MNRDETLHALGLGPIWKLRLSPIVQVGCLFVTTQNDRQGATENGPYQGDAGILLDNMLRAIDWSRDRDIFLGFLGKKSAEMGAVTPEGVIKVQSDSSPRNWLSLQPNLIVALGLPTAHFLLEAQGAIDTLRGRGHRVRGIPLIVTFDPRHLLQHPLDKAKAWEDLCLIRATLETLRSSKA